MKLLHYNGKLGKMAKHNCLFGLFFLASYLLFLTGCTEKEDSPKVPRRQGWVSDYTGILKPAEKERISAALEWHEKETCHQVYLLIIPSLAEEPIAEFSRRTASAWKIGHPGLGNGFLVIIAIEEGTVRIETGPAFEWFIQNGTADRIIKEEMFPIFRENKFVEGIERGLEEIMTAGRLKPIPVNKKPDICRQNT